MTKTLNSIYYLVCALAALLSALPPELVSVIPEKWKPYVAAVSVILMWLKSHWNLFVNPDGTPASVAFRPPQK